MKGPASKDFFFSLIEGAPFGIIASDPSGIIIFLNQLANDYLDTGVPVNELTGHPVHDCAGRSQLLSHHLDKCLNKTHDAFHMESELINNRYLNITGRRTGQGFLIIINDISKQKEIELNSVLSIIAGQENERARLAREIHDGIGPMLSFAKLELDSFMDEFKDLDLELSFEKLNKIRETIDSITSDLRDLSHHLLPKLLDEFGLYSAFSNLVKRLSNSTRTCIEFYCNLPPETRFDKEIELNLYRCGQELLNNALKHASAGEILVQVIRHQDSLVLMVEDNGIGFSKGTTDPDHYGIGLTNIETRVRTLNGEFLLESAAGKGTTASIELPL
jgi:signal transduction histidine kinase